MSEGTAVKCETRCVCNARNKRDTSSMLEACRTDDGCDRPERRHSCRARELQRKLRAPSSQKMTCVAPYVTPCSISATVSQNSTAVFHMQTLAATAASLLATAQNVKNVLQSTEGRLRVLK